MTPVVSPDRVKFQNQAGAFIPVAQGDLILDTTSCLMWTTRDYSFTWDEARAYAERVSEGNFNDWRLPTKAELYGLFVDLKMRQKPGYSVLAAPFKWENGHVEVQGVHYSYWSNKPNPFGNAAAVVYFSADWSLSGSWGSWNWWSKKIHAGVRYIRTPSGKELDEIARRN